ncbi:MAG TPA: DUF948 domain-containing protein, partial [Streptosporangiaceae bacterium]|nr:DUF948 domain-containing protein [Streptosporangiaceae bacterium]
MSAGELAALIAAAFWAAGVCVAAYVLIKLARLLTAATSFLTGMRESTGTLIDQAQAAIDRTREQLDRTDAITANMDQVSADVAELTEHVSALAGLARGLTAGPVAKVAAVTYGVRRAISLRRASGPSASGSAGTRVQPAVLPKPPLPPGPRLPAGPQLPAGPRLAP